MPSQANPLAAAGAGWLPEDLQSHQGAGELIHALFEGNPDMVIVADDQQRIVAANSNALSQFQYLREELEGQPVSNLLPTKMRENHAGHVRSFLANPSVRSMGSGMNLKGRDSRGVEFPLDVMLWPLRTASAQYVVALCRRPDEALKRTQVQMDAVVESVRDYAINLLDPQGRFLTWNEGSRRLHGLSSAEALGKHLSIVFPSEDVAIGEPGRLLREAASLGHYHTAGWRIAANGARIWAEVDFTAIHDGSGRLTGFTRVLHDMTAHKQAEDALRELNRALTEAEERHRLLIESVTDYAIYMLDPDGLVVTWNIGAERSKGYTADEVIGRNFSIFFPPEGIAAGLPSRELAEAGRVGRFETEAWRMRKDGSRFWALVTLTAIHGRGGELRGYVKITRDMTAQKRTAEALTSLNTQLNQYRFIVENVEEYALYTLDPEGRIASWGPGAQKVIGMSADQVIGKYYSIFSTPEDLADGAAEKELAEAARTGRCLTDNWRIWGKDERHWSSGVITAVRDESGNLTGFIRVARNMTRHKLLEEAVVKLNAELEGRVEERTRQLQATVAELQRKNEEVEAFVYIVSHDLRAPLVNVQGFAHELQHSCASLRSILASCSLPESCRDSVRVILDEEVSSALQFISASSSKFERLIEALLGLSRHGRQIYQIVEIDVQELVVNTVASLQQMIADAGASVRIGSLPPISADMTALGQVFSNLIGNAIKYRSPRRRLELDIGGEIEAGSVRYWVRDNGLGIPKAGQSRLFQVFQRLHPQQAQGEGMGLAIVHRIVERHGGKIWAESVEDEGTTFSFTVPIASSQQDSVGRE